MAISQINETIPGMFVLIRMHFSLWFQIWSWNSTISTFFTNFVKFLTCCLHSPAAWKTLTHSHWFCHIYAKLLLYFSFEIRCNSCNLLNWLILTFVELGNFLWKIWNRHHCCSLNVKVYYIHTCKSASQPYLFYSSREFNWQIIWNIYFYGHFIFSSWFWSGKQMELSAKGIKNSTGTVI